MNTGDARDWELLEREGELAELCSAVDAARAGEGAVVAVEGPPGIGKSRLLGAALRLAAGAGVESLTARATELESELPFGAARQLLGETAVAEGVADGEGPEGGLHAAQRLADALLGRVFERGRPAGGAAHLLVVDDLQWADRASLDMVSICALRSEGAPIAVVVAVRSTEPGARGALERLARAAPLRTLRPGPLSEAAVARMVAAAGLDSRFAAACARVSGGNPFYLGELVRELAALGPAATVEQIEDAAPVEVLRAVMARLGAIGADAAALAGGLAVLGDGAGLAHAAELAGIELRAAEQAADDLARAAVLDGGEPLRFAHPLIGSALRADLGAFARARAHRRAAELLAREGAGPERIAAQLLHARPRGDPRAVAVLREAARRSRAGSQPDAAVSLLSRALAEPPAESARAEVLAELAEAEATAGRPESVAHFKEALDGIAAPRSRARAAVSLALTLQHAGEFGRAAAIADEALRQVADDDPLAQRALGAWTAAALLHPPLHDRLGATLAPLIADARSGQLPDDPGLCALLAARLGAFDEPPALARRLAQAAFARDPLVDGDARGAALGYAAYALVCVDALEEAQRLLDGAVRSAERAGLAIALSIARHFRAMVHHHGGRLAEAVADAELALEMHRFGWTASPWSTPILARSQIERGDLHAAREAVAIGERAEADRAERVLLLQARACLALAERLPAEALAAALAAGRECERLGSATSSRPFDWRRLAALAAHAAGERDEAARLAAEAVGRARAAAVGRQLAQALTAAGVIAGGERGIELHEEAVAVLEASPPRLAHAHALLELGGALRRARRRRAAREPLLQALELADGFGALPLVRRVRHELAAVGLRPPRAARSGPDALTDGELRVARLAARGLTTAAIAHELYVTPKTVESHLRQIYRKLGIAGRTELPDLGDERPVAEAEA